MPLSRRGREILERMPSAKFSDGKAFGCEIIRIEMKCAGCGRCVAACPSGACVRGIELDVRGLFDYQGTAWRKNLAAALRKIAQHDPGEPVQVPPRAWIYRGILHDRAKCLGCAACAKACPCEAIEARAPEDKP